MTFTAPFFICSEIIKGKYPSILTMKTKTLSIMKKFFLFFFAVAALTFVGCSDDDSDDGPEPMAETCNDGIMNNGETGVDCGGPNCQPCMDAVDPPTCSDGIQNGNETGVDCGGSCGTPCPGDTVEVDDNITSDTTWSADFVYQLNGRIAVESGATLTIEAGTIIKGNAGQGENATALLVARGATLNAMGTAAAPIIMTSTADNIEPGMIESPNLDVNFSGLWGGLIVLGNAPISVDANDELTVSDGVAQIEGIPANDPNGAYGGTDPMDNSGTITYVSVRHGGTNIGSGNEINGITFGGVGNGTTVNHLEVVANVDDGVEFFGGTVDVNNIIVWAQGDDAVDVDQAFSGTLDNVVVQQGPTSDHALEIDGPEGAATGSYTLVNATLLGDEDGGAIGDFRSGATGANNNILVQNFPAGADVELDNAGVADNFTDGSLSFMTWEVVLADGVTLGDIFDDTTGTTTGFGDFATAVTTPTVGADTSEFSGWSIAGIALGF